MWLPQETGLEVVFNYGYRLLNYGQKTCENVVELKGTLLTKSRIQVDTGRYLVYISRYQDRYLKNEWPLRPSKLSMIECICNVHSNLKGMVNQIIA